MLVKCNVCGKEFQQCPNKIKRNNGASFCSRECYYKYKKIPNKYILHNDCAEILITSLTYGVVGAIIDLEDVEKCKMYQWNLNYSVTAKDFYIRCGNTALHRIVTDCPEGLVVDHLNHCLRDNRKINLKVCTQLENIQNQKKRITNTSRHSNITFNERYNTWRVRISNYGKRMNVGSFKNLNDAIKARDEYLIHKNGNATTSTIY